VGESVYRVCGKSAGGENRTRGGREEGRGIGGIGGGGGRGRDGGGITTGMASLILRILFCCNGRSDNVLFVLYYSLVPTHHSVKFEVSGHPNPGTALYSPVAESLGRIVKRIVRRGAAASHER
jgi:hypothetical protein